MAVSAAVSRPVTRAWVRFAALVGLVIGMGAIILFMVLAWSQETSDIPLLATGFVSVCVGYLILVRTDGNRVGWALIMLATCMAGAGFAGWVSDQGNVVGDATGGAMWFLLFASLGFLFYWFPTGRAISPRWHWVGWLGALFALAAVSYAFADEVCVDGGDVCQTWAPNPIGISWVPNPEHGPFASVTELVLLVFVLAALSSLMVRFVRARGAERLQIKWLAVAGGVLVLGIFLSELLGLGDFISSMVFSLAVLGLPLAVGAAVLRYRLYEIDRIISRTVSYTLIVGLLGSILFGLVAGLGAWVGRDNQLVVAVSTLAVAGLFNPVRRRVQAWVDRRFNRSRYDAERVMSEFAGSLRDRVDPDGVVEGWVGVVSQTMQPTLVGVWVR